VATFRRQKPLNNVTLRAKKAIRSSLRFYYKKLTKVQQHKFNIKSNIKHFKTNT